MNVKADIPISGSAKILLLLFPIFFSIPALSGNEGKPAFVLYQQSYQTACAEEDNVMLQINSANKSIRGVNILAKKPTFNTIGYKIYNGPDFTGCQWTPKKIESTNYYPECFIEDRLGYMDKSNICRLEKTDTVFRDGRWEIIGYRGPHWQPFMEVINQDNRLSGEYKTLTIRRSERPDGGERQVVAAIYSDGYLRPTYFVKADQDGGWGGSFILGKAQSVKVVANRFYHNIKTVKVKNADEILELELVFVDNSDHPAKLVLYYDFNKKGVDFIPAENSRDALLIFASMYRDKTSFDIELLKGKTMDQDRVYNILDHALDKAFFGSRFILAKDNPATHNTLAPDFEITAIFSE
ncbi:MAG: hypothetical protein WAV07_05975 [Candidatus Contendobacter sp.]